MNYNKLIDNINVTHELIQASVSKAVNTGTTLRNWLFGFYIVEFEQNGKDRAKYGDNLLSNISKSVTIKGLSVTNLKLFRQFYKVYPEIAHIVLEYFNSNTFQLSDSKQIQISQSATDQSYKPIRQLLTDEFQNAIIKLISNNTANISDKKLGLKPNKLINTLSFTHLVELIKIDNAHKRAFYELECAKGVWSVRELKRQIESLYLERSGLSKDKEKLSEFVNNKAIKLKPKDIINSPFSIEFLELSDRAIVTETDLEQALVDNLQHFLLEMGNGFCFEARQKRILIDSEYYFVDLVFYNRILKCHVIIELKTEKFHHSHASQLNFYLNYFKEEVMQEGDNPPVGILLCTDKGETTVKYATAGLDETIFVQKYMLNLPSKEELKKQLLKSE